MWGMISEKISSIQSMSCTNHDAIVTIERLYFLIIALLLKYALPYMVGKHDDIVTQYIRLLISLREIIHVSGFWKPNKVLSIFCVVRVPGLPAKAG